MTTFIQNLALFYAMSHPGRNVKSYAQDWPTAEEQFEDIVKVSYEALPKAWRPRNQTMNKRTLAFANGSRYQVQPAVREKGRGGTVSFLHLTEAAFYEDPSQLWAAVSPSIAKENGIVVIESTPNGYNWFKEWYFKAYEKEPGHDKWKSMFFGRDYFFDESIPEDKESLDSKRSELKGTFEQEYPLNHHDCFLVAGFDYFDKKRLNAIYDWIKKDEVGKEIERYDFQSRFGNTGIKEHPHGDLRIWKAPKKHGRYVVGGDVAEGKEDGDDSVLVVIDRETSEAVALYIGRVPEDVFAHYADYLGWSYNDAIMAIENNGPGHAVNRLLQETYAYKNLHYDTLVEKVKQGAAPELGIRVTSKTKHIICGNLQELIDNNEIIIPFEEIVTQLFSFVKKDHKLEAVKGYKDDCVLATAHAAFVHVQNPFHAGRHKGLPKKGTIQEQIYLANMRDKANRTEIWSA